MNEAQSNNTPQFSSVKMLRSMVGIGIMCALIIVLTFQGTYSRIEQNKKEALQKAIFNVLPGIQNTISYSWNEEQKFSILSDQEDSDEKVFAGFDSNGEFVGVAIEASGQGYADIITILYGYDPIEEEIIGFQVLASKETPGLGDKIEKDENFLSNFDALDVSLSDNKTELKNKVISVKSGMKNNPWEVDGITGATISSRAIANIIASSSGYWGPKIYVGQKQMKAKN